MVVREPHDITFKATDSDFLVELRGIPWCNSLLQDQRLRPIQTPSRVSKSTTEDALIARTLATTDTIPAWHTFYIGAQSLYPEERSLGQLYILFSLGSGMDGHPGLVHGGLISAIMDEAMTMLASIHCDPHTSCYTAFLKVDYKRPVATPNTYLSKISIEDRSKGRKIWVKSTLEDGKGTTLAAGQSLVIEVPRTLVPKI